MTNRAFSRRPFLWAHVPIHPKCDPFDGLEYGSAASRELR
jgi:hypothetical protein